MEEVEYEAKHGGAEAVAEASNSCYHPLNQALHTEDTNPV